MSRSNPSTAKATGARPASEESAPQTETPRAATADPISQLAPPQDAGTPGAASGTGSERRVRISSPQNLLAAVPWLLRFQPGRSIVVIGTEPSGGTVIVTLRYDLPDPGRPRMARALARQAVSLLNAHGITNAVLVGYGTDAEVSPVTAALRERAASNGITVTEALRAENGRYWSYVCSDPECRPPEGTPFDPDPRSASELFAGITVLASREALAATLGPVVGDNLAVMLKAVRAAKRDARALAKTTAGMRRREAKETVAGPGLQSVQEVIDQYRAGGSLDSRKEAAKLLVALRSELRVRDDGWARMDPEHGDAHLRMWTDLTRLAPRGYVAPPASLLAFVAWQLGDGALANVALDRALADAPGYSMAELIREALDSGAPPSMARLPMTPEEVALAYGLADEAAEAKEREEEARAEQDRAEAEGGAQERVGSDSDAKVPEGEAALTDSPVTGTSST